MKILLLGFSKMKFMPYASFYLDQLDYQKNEVDIVYWNRDLEPEDLSKYNSSIVFHEFKDRMADWISKSKKITHFYRYRNYVKKVLSSKHFDFVISLHTLPGLLVLDKLKKYYKGKYILDYRDSTFEHIRFYGSLVKELALNSKVVYVSSDAFRRFLPENGIEIITSHNILADSLLHRDDRKLGYITSDKIRISFWGFIRHYQHNEKIISHLGNDPRFELHYYGRKCAVGEAIRKYVTDHSINNVYVHGEYKPEERYEFIKHTDIIHNSYYDNNTMLAMGNKYYDGIIFRIPLLCMSGSYMAERCTKRGVGFAFDPDDNEYANKIFNTYNQINWPVFEANCDKELELIISEYDYGSHRIANLLSSELITD